MPANSRENKKATRRASRGSCITAAERVHLGTILDRSTTVAQMIWARAQSWRHAAARLPPEISRHDHGLVSYGTSGSIALSSQWRPPT